MQQNKMVIVEATSIVTGETVYLELNEQTCEDYLQASSSLPILYRSSPVFDSTPMTDGGIAHSMPVIEAYRRGDET